MNDPIETPLPTEAVKKNFSIKVIGIGGLLYQAVANATDKEVGD